MESRRAEAAEQWKKIARMRKDYMGKPMILRYILKAKHQIAKMQNTLGGGGDEGMVAIDAEHEANMDMINTVAKELPSANYTSTAMYQEPDRIVFHGEMNCPEGSQTKAMEDLVRHMRKAGLDPDDLDMAMQVGKGAFKSCAHCGRKAYVEGQNQSAEKFELRVCSLSCGKEWYCGKECQKAHWKVHRKQCTRSRKANPEATEATPTEAAASASVDVD